MIEAERLNNIGSQLYRDGKRQVALSLIKKALYFDPKNDGIICNLACVLTNFGRYEEAAKIFHDLVSRKPTNILAWHGYGVLNLVSGRPNYAQECFSRCIDLDPENGSYKFDLACAVIQLGNWKQGLKLYECRRKWKPERTFKDLTGWTGEAGQKVYVWAEQGIGDTIQFSRYIPWMSKICEKLTFAVPPYLLDLFKPFEKYCQVVSLVGAMIDADYHVPLMSLAHYHGMDKYVGPADFGTRTPNGYKIGICWACNPSSANYRERSIPLVDLLRLTELPFEFHSLQVGSSASDASREASQNLIIDHSAECTENWLKTRDIISECDYVVSTDTSVAHLASSMGVPTIMFLARRDWWRWGNEGSSTLWYPSMTIIRQEIPFKWEKEIDQAYAILEKAARERNQELAA